MYKEARIKYFVTCISETRLSIGEDVGFYQLHYLGSISEFEAGDLRKSVGLPDRGYK
jgi:hypothetical protein